jgi:hypothetical protein
MFGHVGRIFSRRHYNDSDAIVAHRLDQIFPAIEHLTDDPCRFGEGGVGDFGRADDQHPADIDLLLVEGIELPLLAKRGGDRTRIGGLDLFRDHR